MSYVNGNGTVATLRVQSNHRSKTIESLIDPTPTPKTHPILRYFPTPESLRSDASVEQASYVSNQTANFYSVKHLSDFVLDGLYTGLVAFQGSPEVRKNTVAKYLSKSSNEDRGRLPAEQTVLFSRLKSAAIGFKGNFVPDGMTQEQKSAIVDSFDTNEVYKILLHSMYGGKTDYRANLHRMLEIAKPEQIKAVAAMFFVEDYLSRNLAPLKQCMTSDSLSLLRRVVILHRGFVQPYLLNGAAKSDKAQGPVLDDLNERIALEAEKPADRRDPLDDWRSMVNDYKQGLCSLSHEAQKAIVLNIELRQMQVK